MNAFLILNPDENNPKLKNLRNRNSFKKYYACIV
ncbi:hypothetical protein JOD96_002931 [Flavobacterium sp. 1355]|nr:hypothetical protein [Flavobacterium sp. 1355]